MDDQRLESFLGTSIFGAWFLLAGCTQLWAGCHPDSKFAQGSMGPGGRLAFGAILFCAGVALLTLAVQLARAGREPKPKTPAGTLSVATAVPVSRGTVNPGWSWNDFGYHPFPEEDPGDDGWEIGDHPDHLRDRGDRDGSAAEAQMAAMMMFLGGASGAPREVQLELRDAHARAEGRYARAQQGEGHE